MISNRIGFLRVCWERMMCLDIGWNAEVGDIKSCIKACRFRFISIVCWLTWNISLSWPPFFFLFCHEPFKLHLSFRDSHRVVLLFKMLLEIFFMPNALPVAWRVGLVMTSGGKAGCLQTWRLIIAWFLAVVSMGKSLYSFYPCECVWGCSERPVMQHGCHISVWPRPAVARNIAYHHPYVTVDGMNNGVSCKGLWVNRLFFLTTSPT